MTKRANTFTSRSKAGADRLFLVLSFFAGALAAHFRLGAAALLPQGLCSAAALLIPALAAGAPSGIWLIPLAALLLGCSTAQSAETALALFRATPVSGLRALLPSLLLTPAFFLLALAAMRLSGESMAVFCSRDPASRRALLLQHLLLWIVGLGAAALLMTTVK